MSITEEPKDFQILFLDMNSFFASVEQQVRPELRGQPIGVAPYTGNSGCIIAASREAKKMGVSISRIGEARKICPNIKIVESRPALYMLYHKEIKKAIESCTPYLTPLSIDEFAIRLDRAEQSLEKSYALALRLKKAIHDQVGDFLTCSIGIGPSRFLAKMAGERHKPDGLTVVQLKDLEEFYSELKLTDLTGINYRMEARLKFLKINSPTELFNCPLSRLREKLGHMGRLWHFRLRGYEVGDFEVKNKTIGHSHVLAPEFRSVGGALAVLQKLIFKTGFRLRKEGYWACGVSVYVGFYGGSPFRRAKKTEAFCDNFSLSRHIEVILRECRWQGKPSYLSIATFGLTRQDGRQISIFDEIEKRQAMCQAIDEVNDEYGAETLFPASMMDSRFSAPDRIPFGQPRYEIIH